MGFAIKSHWISHLLTLTAIILAVISISLTVKQYINSSSVKIRVKSKPEQIQTSNETLNSLLKKIAGMPIKKLEKTDSEPTSPSTSRDFSPVSLHVHYKPTVVTNSATGNSENFTKHHQYSVTFDEEDVTSGFVEHKRGVGLGTEGISILHSGMYYIYSNVGVQDTLVSLNQYGVKTFHMYIHRASPNFPARSGVLMRSLQTCSDCSSYSETDFVGGVFYLQVGDVIRVTLAKTDNVDFDITTSFLGLFMLSVQ